MQITRVSPFLNRTLKRWCTGLALAMAAMLTVWGLAVLPPSLSQMPQSPMHELRGVWLTNIDSEVLFSRDRLQKGLRQLAQLNFNTVYPTVWNWGYTLYPSQVAAQVIGETQRLYPDVGNTGTIDLKEATQQGRDMLRELVAIAHARHLNVVPWFEFGFMAPADSALAQRHPNWLTQRRDGTTVLMEGSHPRVWLNPMHPEVQGFILQLIQEVVVRYPIDGIQLDDHFGLPVDLGYDPFTVALYRQEHGDQPPPDDPHAPDWIRWRANKITAVMSQVFTTIKSQNPKAVVSLSPNPAPFAYETFLQDWPDWERRGYLEELVVQVYRSDRNRFLIELERPEIQRAQQHIPVSIGILTGLKNRDVPMGWIQQQVKWVRDRRLAGVAFFFYETLWTSQTERPKQRSDGFRAVFSQAALRPVLWEGWAATQSR
ncbi:MAG: glycoside hydrolase family 10 protein [Thermosynechococcaceae cyanobacterium]